MTKSHFACSLIATFLLPAAEEEVGSVPAVRVVLSMDVGTLDGTPTAAADSAAVAFALSASCCWFHAWMAPRMAWSLVRSSGSSSRAFLRVGSAPAPSSRSTAPRAQGTAAGVGEEGKDAEAVTVALRAVLPRLRQHIMIAADMAHTMVCATLPANTKERMHYFTMGKKECTVEP